MLQWLSCSDPAVCAMFMKGMTVLLRPAVDPFLGQRSSRKWIVHVHQAAEFQGAS